MLGAMMILPQPDVILTHESDLDGLVAGVLLQRLAKKLFGREVRLEAWNYQGWRNRPMTERSAWVTDLVFDARLDKANWVIVDHHPTDTKPTQSQLIFDGGKSASLLCYELCQQQGLGSPTLDRLVQLSNVADLFLEDDPDFALAVDYASLVKIYGFWNLHALLDGEIEKLVDHPFLEVMSVKRRIEDPIGYEWSQRNIREITPQVGFVENVVGNTNLIVHQLLERQATKYPVLVTAFRKATGSVIVSFRSRNGEAIKVAEKLQGGGHANASATTLPRSVRSVPDALTYLRQTLNARATTSRGEASLNSLASAFDQLDKLK
jgi:oligoribonuclease NrnB/cAMP/cGMP phosphodiesterase (DHH superfamily)